MASIVKDKKIGDMKNLGSLESPVVKYLALENEERELTEKLSKVRAAIRKMKKNSHLMTVIGDLKRIQSNLENPERSMEKQKKTEAMKQKAGRDAGTVPRIAPFVQRDKSSSGSEEVVISQNVKRAASDEPGGPTAKERLAKKLKEGPPPVDKTIQPGKK